MNLSSCQFSGHKHKCCPFIIVQCPVDPVNLLPCICFAWWWWQPPTRWCHWHSLPRVDQLWPADGKCYTLVLYFIFILASLSDEHTRKGPVFVLVIVISFRNCPCLAHVQFCPLSSRDEFLSFFLPISFYGWETNSAGSHMLWRFSREVLSKTNSMMRKSHFFPFCTFFSLFFPF